MSDEKILVQQRSTPLVRQSDYVEPAESPKRGRPRLHQDSGGQAKKSNGNGNGHTDLHGANAKLLKNPTHIRVDPTPMETGTVLEGVSQKVFLDRYSLKDEKGNPIEKYPEQMWRRLAVAGSRIETPEKQKEWEDKFYSCLEGFKFVPGGRILSGAGTGYDVTYYNCYVLPSPQDSRWGIMHNLSEMIDIMARGGGVGVNLSSLRPRGSRVRKINGFSSGPINWAELYSVATHDVIQQGGTRRGALMLMLWDWHPDVEEFITVKKDLSRINGANLSVCVSDSFMEAVKTDSDWDLVFPDLDDPEYDQKWDGILDSWIKLGKRVIKHKTIKARALWDLICEAAWASAEPGLVFMERYNKEHSNAYFNTINCVNPCVTADTLVTTDRGMIPMGRLYERGKPFMAVLDGKQYLSSPPFKTGVKPVYRLITKEGYELRLTGDHKVYTEDGKVEAGKLKKGEKILLTNGGAFGIQGTLEEGRVWGWLVGDGSVKKEDATLFFYGEEKQELAPQFANTVQAMVSGEGLTMRSYTTNPIYVEKEDKAFVESRRLHRLAERLGFTYGNKHFVPDEVLSGSEGYQRGFLQGIFSSDGHVAGTPEKGVSVRLTSISRDLLIGVQRLLINFGIVSKIYYNRRVEQERMLPDGKGGKRLYNTKAQHDLIISGQGVTKFAAVVGFLQEAKQEKLRSSLALYTKGPYSNLFTATFDRLEEDGVEEVFDITVNEVHRFVANGLVISNCGEEGLPAYGVCNLGSLNLSAFVNENGELDYDSLAEHARVAVRFNDNIIDGDIYIFDGIRKTQLEGERRVGVGTMGLGDALIKMKIRYGSEESLPVIERIYKTIRDAAFGASSDYAQEKGAFMKFDSEKYMQGKFIQRLPQDLQDKIRRQGVRNSVILMQAPTGSTSLMCGVTSGIEPVYEFSFTRRDRLGEHKIYHPLYQEWLALHPGEEVPSYFVSANDLTPEEHIKVQAAVQKYVDASISKTVNAPNSHTIDDVKKLYTLAYELGLKGIAYMRDGSREGVLSREESKVPKVPEVSNVTEPTQQPLVAAQPALPGTGQYPALLPRPVVLKGATYHIATPVGNAFITINEDQAGNPQELFITVGKAGSDVGALAEGLGRVISIMLRSTSYSSPIDKISKITDQLRGIGGRRSVGFGENRVLSLPDAVAIALSRHYGLRGLKNADPTISSNGALRAETPFSGDTTLQAGAVKTAHNPDLSLAPALPATSSTHTVRSGPPASTHADICPECGVAALVHEEGCSKCYACGHAEC